MDRFTGISMERNAGYNRLEVGSSRRPPYILFTSSVGYCQPWQWSTETDLIEPETVTIELNGRKFAYQRERRSSTRTGRSTCSRLYSEGEKQIPSMIIIDTGQGTQDIYTLDSLQSVLEVAVDAARVYKWEHDDGRVVWERLKLMDLLSQEPGAEFNLPATNRRHAMALDLMEDIKRFPDLFTMQRSVEVDPTNQLPVDPIVGFKRRIDDKVKGDVKVNDIMEWCRHDDPHERPTARVLYAALKGLQIVRRTMKSILSHLKQGLPFWFNHERQEKYRYSATTGFVRYR